MPIFDRFLLREFLRFVLLALLAVVGIYLLIDLFEDLNYFMAHRVSLLVLARYYLYYTPSVITLLFPVSFVLACFMVYGQLTRQRELAALQSAGIDTYRLFLPVVGFGLASVLILYLGNEYVTIPSMIAQAELKRYTIEKRALPAAQVRRDMNYLADDGRIFYAREFIVSGTLKNFVILDLDSTRHRVRSRIDGAEAEWREGAWLGRKVTIRTFLSDTTERLVKHDTVVLADIHEKPADFALENRPVEQLTVPELTRYVARMRRAGYLMGKELVELNYRFSYPFVGLILLIMALPLSVQLRRGGVMLGLGLGLLFSFLYWGLIQTARAFGQSGVWHPVLAAWLPNVIFLIVGLALIPTVKR